MTRVVVKSGSDAEKLMDAAFSCPVNAFKKGNNQMVIDPDECIDCGVCQSEAPEGVIIEDSEASKEDIAFNTENSKKWEPAQ